MEELVVAGADDEPRGFLVVRGGHVDDRADRS
jgi:hypothetical protein